MTMAEKPASPRLPAPPTDLDWIKLRDEMEEGNEFEPLFHKLIRKFKAQPLIPLGCLATTAALSYGLWSFKKGDQVMSQYMMRTRVLAQGFTVFVAVSGMVTASRQASTPE
ncbi:HIG1 domain family member 2A, mitochondrial [Diachasma alloeum]|uniref:HIG1 domain family member 2A, mitochondrial n=1 Tax=Diachasma alloeum TaxID=454923 RepID=UPI0007384B67|nr:HIG1 domain family member 2A, mitochondrial [Diachasma alloeum]